MDAEAFDSRYMGIINCTEDPPTNRLGPERQFQSLHVYTEGTLSPQRCLLLTSC